jgi:hypothetical protein
MWAAITARDSLVSETRRNTGDEGDARHSAHNPAMTGHFDTTDVPALPGDRMREVPQETRRFTRGLLSRSHGMTCTDSTAEWQRWP